MLYGVKKMVPAMNCFDPPPLLKQLLRVSDANGKLRYRELDNTSWYFILVSLLLP